MGRIPIDACWSESKRLDGRNSVGQRRIWPMAAALGSKLLLTPGDLRSPSPLCRLSAVRSKATRG